MCPIQRLSLFPLCITLMKVVSFIECVLFVCVYVCVCASFAQNLLAIVHFICCFAVGFCFDFFRVRSKNPNEHCIWMTPTLDFLSKKVVLSRFSLLFLLYSRVFQCLDRPHIHRVLHLTMTKASDKWIKNKGFWDLFPERAFDAFRSAIGWPFLLVFNSMYSSYARLKSVLRNSADNRRCRRIALRSMRMVPMFSSSLLILTIFGIFISDTARSSCRTLPTKSGAVKCAHAATEFTGKMVALYSLLTRVIFLFIYSICVCCCHTTTLLMCQP